jgi:hypothetical protein
MNARRIIDLFKYACLKHVNPPLGRWNIHNYKQTALKIKYANEDNCGVSWNYHTNTSQIQQNNASNQSQDQDQDIDNIYIYMMGCETVPDKVYISR